MVKTFQLDEDTINNKGQTGHDLTEKIADYLEKADSYIEGAYEEINRHSELRYVEYNSLSSDIIKIRDYSRDYQDFKKFTSEYNDNVDSIFFKAQEEAMKYLSNVRLEEIKVDNNMGITEKYTNPYSNNMPVQDIPKDKLSIEDVLGNKDFDTMLRAEYEEQKKTIEKMKELVKDDNWPPQMTEEQKQQIKDYVSSLGSEEEQAKLAQLTYEDQIKGLLTQGEFDYETKGEKVTTVVLDCIPVVGDIKGIAEAITGKDLVSGRRLSNLERGVSFTASVVGLIPVAHAEATAAKLATKEAAKELAKQAAKQTAKNLAATAAFMKASEFETSLGWGPKAQLAANITMMFAGGKAKSKLTGSATAKNFENAVKGFKEGGLESELKDLSNLGSTEKDLAHAVSDVKKVSDEANVMKDMESQVKDLKNVDEASIASKASKVETAAKDADAVANLKNENINKNAAEEGKNASKAGDDIETISKDKAEMSTGTVKDEVKDAANSEANIAKTADEAGQALKNENVAKDVVADATKASMINTVTKEAKSIEDEVKEIVNGEHIPTVSKDIKNENINNINENISQVSRGEYLRNKFKDKYGIELSAQDVNNRINLKDKVINEMNRKIDEINRNIAKEIEKLPKKHKSLIAKIKKDQAKELGPAIAGVLDKKTGKIYFGKNTTTGRPPEIMHETIKDKVKNMPEYVKDYYKATNGAGSHAEVNALNEALLDRKDADISDFIVYVVSTGYDAKGSGKLIEGMSMARCPHCEYITNGSNFVPEVKWYNKLQGREFGDYGELQN